MSTVTCSGVSFVVTPTNIANGIVPVGTIYRWDVPTYTGTITGGASAQNVPLSISGQLLNRTNTLQTATYIVTPSISNCGDGAPFTIVVSLRPTPEITGMSAVTCSGVLFRVTPTNGTDGIVPAGTVYKWDMPTYTATMTGGQTAANQSSVFGTLRNTVNTTQTATYLVTPITASGCQGAVFTVTVTIPPTPEITAMSTVTCSGVLFVATPTNITNGIVPASTLYSWSVPSYTGTVTGGASATNYPTIVTGTLRNRTNTVQTVTYIITPLSGNCTGLSFTLVVNVNPIPEITAMSTVTCSGTPFVVTPTNGTDGIVP
ncbi:MAG: hypothetical protein EBX50_22940, partial [Chitinophagia bacterium]|nr:hypothetical protein [Chitinophagia bacterium]